MKDANGNEVEDPIVATPEPETPPPTVDDGGIEVVVEEPPIQETPEPPVPPVDLVALKNKTFAQDRIINNMRRSMEEQARMMSETSKTIEQLRTERQARLFVKTGADNATEDDVDKLVKEGKWKEGVKLMMSRQIAEATEAQKIQAVQVKQVEEVKATQQANIAAVVQKHPELDDLASEKWATYQTVLAENPRWRNSPDGPLLAMYVMEERMNLARTPRSAAPVVVRPGVPVGGISSLPAAGKPVAGNKVTLTGEQKAFCDDNNIPYEEYAKSLGFIARGEGKVGISV